LVELLVCLALSDEIDIIVSPKAAPESIDFGAYQLQESLSFK
jgi:hypothetical protein